MKTTLDIPDDIVRAIKLKALHEGKKLKYAITDILRAGLAAETSTSKKTKYPKIIKDRKTGLPVIQGGRTPSRGRGLTPEVLADILVAQEAEWVRDIAGS